MAAFHLLLTPAIIARIETHFHCRRNAPRSQATCTIRAKRLTSFDHPHILIGKSEMVTNFMHQNMSNNRIQRDLTSSPKTEDRIPIEKNHIGQVSGRRILCLKLGAQATTLYAASREG